MVIPYMMKNQTIPNVISITWKYVNIICNLIISGFKSTSKSTENYFLQVISLFIHRLNGAL